MQTWVRPNFSVQNFPSLEYSHFFFNHMFLLEMIYIYIYINIYIYPASIATRRPPASMYSRASSSCLDLLKALLRLEP